MTLDKNFPSGFASFCLSRFFIIKKNSAVEDVQELKKNHVELIDHVLYLPDLAPPSCRLLLVLQVETYP